MLDKLKQETKHALELLDSSQLSTQLKSLLKQLTTEVDQAIEDGDWNLAVKLSYYRHEFAKLHGPHDWYPVFLEIRKMRDMLDLLGKKV